MNPFCISRFLNSRITHHIGELSQVESMLLEQTLQAARKGYFYFESNEEIDLSQKLHPFLRREGKRYYLAKNFEMQRLFFEHIERLAGYEVLETAFPSAGLNDEQKQAVLTALQYRVTFFMGGPGTGKTHTASAIVKFYEENDLLASSPLVLLAPTARAADHLKKKILQIGFNEKNLGFAGTLHRLLGPQHLKTPPLAPWLNASLIIVDETSMIEASVLLSLVASISTKSRVVFMGDPYQLHPVGLRNWFGDLGSSDFLIGKAYLRTCLRTENQHLLNLAFSILQNKAWDFPLLSWDFQSPNKFYNQLWEHVSPYFIQPSKKLATKSELFQQVKSFRILSALKKGPFGTDAINEELFKRLKRESSESDILVLPIQTTRNDPYTGRMNGELGLLIHYRDRGEILFEDTDEPMDPLCVSSYEYAFCTSVHKSQGNEFDHVVLLIPPGSENLGKEVFYTGITRAKKTLSMAVSVGFKQIEERL